MGATRGRRIAVLTALLVATIVAILGMTAVWVALVWWHPAPWTGRLIPLLILALAALAWLEFVRSRALVETPAVRPS
jgi:hypothetical protein